MQVHFSMIWLKILYAKKVYVWNVQGRHILILYSVYSYGYGHHVNIVERFVSRDQLMPYVFQTHTVKTIYTCMAITRLIND